LKSALFYLNLRLIFFGRNMPQNTVIEIDSNSGFCAGVINAIQTAEGILKRDGMLYCLGDIVHNNEEMQRLTNMGLRVITHEEFQQLRHTRVLIRAHGEPPETYRIAKENDIEIIDATCKVVLNLQRTIRQYCQETTDGQILIYGKQGHAEVIGLMGQTDGKGKVLSDMEDIENVDVNHPTRLFSQTTQNIEEYREIIAALEQRFALADNAANFKHADTICHSVVNRAEQLRKFATQYGTIIFVSGEKSSNGLYLFDICKKANPNTFFISKIEQLDTLNVLWDKHIGICGATSTPMWLMEKVKTKILTLNT